jgi:polar amino acid transport system permease protein
VIASLFFDRPNAPAPRWARVLTIVVVTALFAAACWFSLASSIKNWPTVASYHQVFLEGWLLTIQISLCSLGLSAVFGLLLALARRSNFLPLRSLAMVYIELVRGSPLLVQILFLWYVVAANLGFDNLLIAGVLVLSNFSAAYLAEIFRAGIESIGASQLESARAIGLSRFQTYRFVIFPQAFRQVLPPLAGQFASLIKDSSLLSVIGLSEFTHSAQQVNSSTYSTLESYLPLGIGYLLLTLPVIALSRLLERRFHYET